MKLYQGLAVFVLLLHLGSCANMTYMCSNNYTQYERCKHIITAFEQALLEQEANIFALDNQFYPSDRYPTDSFLVGYILINGTSAPDVMIRGWCKSSTYVIASPIMLETLFTGLPYFFNVIVSRQLARSNDGFFSMMSEQITTSKNFVLNLTQYKYTKDEIEYALDYITPWLKVYAKKDAQTGRRIAYNHEDKGYTYTVCDYSWPLTLISVIVTVTIICLSTKILGCLLDENCTYAKEETKRAFFFSIGPVVSLINLADIIFTIWEVYSYFNQEIDIDGNILKEEKDKLIIRDNHKVTKVLQIVAGSLVFIIGGFMGQIYSRVSKSSLLKTTLKPKPPKCLPRCICIPNFCCFSFMFTYFANIYYFAFVIGQNIVPTILLMLITPIETIALVVVFVTMLSSVVMSMAVITFHYDKHEKKKEKENRHGNMKNELINGILTAFLYYLVLFSTGLVLGILLVILAQEKNDTLHLAPISLSLFSTILSVLMGYVTKRILREKKKTENIEGGLTDTQTSPGTDTEQGERNDEHNNRIPGSDNELGDPNDETERLLNQTI